MLRILSILFGVLILSACMKSGSEQADVSEKVPVATVPKEEVEKVEPEQIETSAPLAPSPAPTDQPEQSKPEQLTTNTPALSAPTEEQIKQKYHAELTQLQSYYSGKLSGLYGQAVQDLKAGSSAKELYGQYAKQAGAITEESQAKVNQVLAKMKAELNANHLPLTGVDQYRSVYHQEIGRAKSDALQKLRAAAGLD